MIFFWYLLFKFFILSSSFSLSLLLLNEFKIIEDKLLNDSISSVIFFSFTKFKSLINFSKFDIISPLLFLSLISL